MILCYKWYCNLLAFGHSLKTFNLFRFSTRSWLWEWLVFIIVHTFGWRFQSLLYTVISWCSIPYISYGLLSMFKPSLFQIFHHHMPSGSGVKSSLIFVYISCSYISTTCYFTLSLVSYRDLICFSGFYVQLFTFSLTPLLPISFFNNNILLFFFFIILGQCGLAFFSLK